MVADEAGRSAPALLQAAADALKARAPDFVPLVIAETGCTTMVGRTMQVPMVATRLERYAAGALESSVIPLAPQEVQATALAPGGLIGALARRARRSARSRASRRTTSRS